jgi:hypothetical protein
MVYNDPVNQEPISSGRVKNQIIITVGCTYFKQLYTTYPSMVQYLNPRRVFSGQFSFFAIWDHLPLSFLKSVIRQQIFCVRNFFFKMKTKNFMTISKSVKKVQKVTEIKLWARCEGNMDFYR